MIRPVLATETATLSMLARQTFNDTFADTCTAEDMEQFLKTTFSEEALLKELETEGDYCFFITVDGIPAGYLRFMEDYSSFETIRQWKALELKRIYIQTQFQGLGIAAQLMDFLLAYANDKGYEVVWLGVWEHNYRAHKFYQKYGFINSGYTHDFPIGNTPQTDNWLWKFLK